MGNCKTKRINTGAQYYFNDVDDLTQIQPGDPASLNINNASMEQRVSLTIQIKNVDVTTEHKVELLIYNEHREKIQ